MNIIFKIGIFLLASSFIMVVYVWVKDYFHKKEFVDIEISKNELLLEEQENDLAA